MKRAYFKSIPSMTSHLDITIVEEKGKDVMVETLMEQGFAEANKWIGIISAWQEGTELYEVNKYAGVRPVKVCKELFALIKRSIKISELTDGLFDVTFASIDKVWFFDKPMLQKPSEEDIAASVKNINYKYIQPDEKEQTIFITNKGTKIELGAIGKGFIANKIKKLLQDSGVESGMVNAGGDLTAWGKNEKGNPWKIAIADPEKKEKLIAWVPLQQGGIATSGSYERFALIDGEKYAHIIHPKTGHPVKGLKSVTIISPDIELCDAIATAVFLLGKEDGLVLVNRFEELQCFIVDDEDKFYYSDNLKKVNYAAK